MALCFRGRKWANCVVVDYPIKVWTTRLEEADKLEIPEYQGKPYPVARMADSLLSLSKKNGITVAAERLLRAALDGSHLSEEAIDAKPSENGEIIEPVKKKRAKKTAGEPKPPKKEKPVVIGRSPTVVGTICAKLKLDPKVARKMLRKAGLHAPYADAAKVEEILTKGKSRDKAI